MILHSLRMKILILVGGGLLLATIGIAYLSHRGMQQTIDRSQTIVYQGELDHLLATLAQYNDELEKTLQVEAYRDQFQEEALRIVRLNFLSDSDENVYPFISNNQGIVLLHPKLAFGDKSLAKRDFVQTMLNTSAGSFKYHYLGEDKWLVYARFEPWGWVVGYSLKQSYMYADLARFHQALLPGLFVILLIVTAVLFYGLQRFLRPIIGLTKSAGIIAEGDFDKPIEVKGHDEVAVLAYNFESMRTAVRETITSLDNQRRELKKEVMDRLRAENQAQAAEERLSVILRSVADALLVTDLNGKVQLYNPAALASFPKAETEKRLRDILGDTTLEEEIEPILRGEKDQIQVELCLQYVGDGMRNYNTNSAAILVSDKRLIGVVTILHDVTKARELDQLKNEFLSVAAHELSTPLSVIQGFSELLSNDPKTTLKDRREYINTILQHCESLDSLIEDLLDVSRLETGQGITVRLEEFDLGKSTEQLVKEYQSSTKKHQYIIHPPTSPIIVSADGGKILRVMGNLLSNAGKFSPENSFIEVTCEAKDGFAWVSVKDQGIGISLDKQDRVFEKFYRINSSNTAPQGLGLGLNIAQNIIIAHGGKINLESRHGKGATFSFCLPLTSTS